MKVLLLNPKFPPSLWDFARASHLTGKPYAHPPLSLPTLAALCPPSVNVELADENVETLNFDPSYDLVGITGYFIQKDRVFEIADRFRALGVRVVLGGPLLNAGNAEECLEHADAVFVGEAEYTWPAYLDALLRGDHVERVYHQTEFVDMSDSPVPRYDLLQLERYTTATIETSRGCPQRCEFCEIPSRLGGKSRGKSVAQVMREVETLVSLGADSIFFVDDHFLGNRARTVELLEALADYTARGANVYFSCQFTINHARDEELVGLLRKAGFRRVFCGIETPRKESLLSVKKKQNVVGDLVENVRALQRAGILVWSGMILGFDTDDGASFDEMLLFLEQASIPVAMIGLLTAIPNTPLFDRMARDGRLRQTVDFGGVRGGVQELLVTNIEPVCMPEADLLRGYQRVLGAFYAPEAFGRRLLAAIAMEDAPRPHGSQKVTREDLETLARIVKFYVFHPDPAMRRLFVHVTFETLRRHRTRLQVAMLHLVAFAHMNAFFRDVVDVDVERLPRATRATKPNTRLPLWN